MEMNNLTLTPDERDKMDDDLDKLDHLASEIYFDDLVKMSAEICLSRSLPELEFGELTDRQKLFEEMGVMSLRTALEIQMGHETHFAGSISDEEMEDADSKGLTYLHLDTTMRKPSLFYDKANYKIAKKAEQFGKAIIDEAFTVLGQDAGKYVELMKSDDADDRMRAVCWLFNRINALSKSDDRGEPDAPDEPDALLYHPIRLSPKAIGRYPDTRLKPTCLAASILAASFFERAEVPYMHAGVMVTGYQGKMKQAVAALELVGRKLEQSSGNSEFIEKITKLSSKISTKLGEDRGYHAAIYVWMDEKNWLQFDPYFDVLTYLPTIMSVDADRIYDTLG